VRLAFDILGGSTSSSFVSASMFTTGFAAGGGGSWLGVEAEDVLGLESGILNAMPLSTWGLGEGLGRVSWGEFLGEFLGCLGGKGGKSGPAVGGNGFLPLVALRGAFSESSKVSSLNPLTSRGPSQLTVVIVELR
jgi:hypothetical protein